MLSAFLEIMFGVLTVLLIFVAVVAITGGR